MDKMRFRLYIPFGRDIDLLNKAINSVIPQIEEFSNYEGRKIVVINNSSINEIAPLLEHPEAVEIWRMPFELVHAQEANWMIKSAFLNDEPFCMTTHTDSELLPGAMENLLNGYLEHKDKRWSMITVPGWSAIFALYNPKFFVEENVWFDPFLFPFYYMDNHMGRIMTLRGWPGYITESAVPLINHKSSHVLKDDPVFGQKNNLAFPCHGQIYANIWGGLPGSETRSDIYANGTLPRP